MKEKNVVRKDGSILKMLPVLLSIVALSILSLIYLSLVSDMDKKEAAQQLAREYILGMESKGYLDVPAQNNLIADLEELGFESINLSGTTMSGVHYGNVIVLNITAYLSTDRYETNGLFSIDFLNENRRINICKKTTAKN